MEKSRVTSDGQRWGFHDYNLTIYYPSTDQPYPPSGDALGYSMDLALCTVTCRQLMWQCAGANDSKYTSHSKKYFF